MGPADPKSMDTPIFTARLVPHRSLDRRGLSLVMAFVGVVGLVTSVPFYLMGAWPVAGFMGIDVLMIYVAFRLNNAAARRYEEIILSPLLLVVRAVDQRGRVAENRFNPRWARLVRDDHPEYGIENLTLIEGRSRVELASCLGRDARGAFADEFRRALLTAKR